MIKKLTIPVDHGNRNMKTTHFLFTTGLSSTDRKPAGREDFLQTCLLYTSDAADEL